MSCVFGWVEKRISEETNTVRVFSFRYEKKRFKFESSSDCVEKNTNRSLAS